MKLKNTGVNRLKFYYLGLEIDLSIITQKQKNVFLEEKAQEINTPII